MEEIKRPDIDKYKEKIKPHNPWLDFSWQEVSKLIEYIEHLENALKNKEKFIMKNVKGISYT